MRSIKRTLNVGIKSAQKIINLEVSSYENIVINPEAEHQIALNNQKGHSAFSCCTNRFSQKKLFLLTFFGVSHIVLKQYKNAASGRNEEFSNDVFNIGGVIICSLGSLHWTSVISSAIEPTSASLE